MVLATFGAMRLTSPRVGARSFQDIEGRFLFVRMPLPEVEAPGIERRLVRHVHPAFQHVRAFLSTLGAGAAVRDLDGNGLPDDVCYIDTITDRVLVAPVPGTGDRYPPFPLDPHGLAKRDRELPSGCVPADFNEDGHPDLLVTYAGRTPLLYSWRPATSSGAPRLSTDNYIPTEILPGGQIWTTTTATLADLDGDGHLDLVIGNYFGDGQAIFDPAATMPVEMPDTFSRAFNGGGLRVFRVTPNARPDQPPVFTEVRDAFPADYKGWTLALGAHDIDGDLLPELYAANDFGPDRFFWNRSTPGHIRFELLEGEPGFAIPHSKVLGRDSFKGMGIDFGDLNGDGKTDMFVSNITTPFAFQESQLVFLGTGSMDGLAKGRAPFVEGGESLGLARSGWAWDVKLDDFDNDGVLEALQAVGFLRGTTNKWPELHELALVNDRLTARNAMTWPVLGPGDDVSGHDKNPFYTRIGATYVDIAGQIGFEEESVSRGLATADVDGDGRMDVIVANQMGSSTYYHNQATRRGSFLGLHLELPVRGTHIDTTVIRDGHPRPGDPPSRPAVGATAVIFLPDGRRVTRQVDGGNGHTGRRSPDLHFGLGATQSPVRVDLTWRDVDGRTHKETYSLTPGWHTIWLKSPERVAS